MQYEKAEFREANFYPDEIFWYLNRVPDSVKDGESDDIKNLSRFPGNPVLGIVIKICNCVGSTHIRG